MIDEASAAVGSNNAQKATDYREYLAAPLAQMARSRSHLGYIVDLVEPNPRYLWIASCQASKAVRR